MFLWNKKFRLRMLVTLVAGMLCGIYYSGPARSSGIPVFDVTNLAENLLAAERALEQIDNQLKMLESLNFDASGDLTQILNQTNAVLNQVEGIAYNVGQVSEQFENIYPENMGGMSYDELLNLKDSVLEQTRNAQQHAVELQAFVASSIPQTQAIVSDLVNRSNAAPGPTAAIQANTQVLATMSTQLAQMQTLLMAQTRAFNAYIQEQNTRSAVAQEQRERMFEGIEQVGPRTDNFNPLDY